MVPCKKQRGEPAKAVLAKNKLSTSRNVGLELYFLFTSTV